MALQRASKRLKLLEPVPCVFESWPEINWVNVVTSGAEDLELQYDVWSNYQGDWYWEEYDFWILIDSRWWSPQTCWWSWGACVSAGGCAGHAGRTGARWPSQKQKRTVVDKCEMLCRC